MAFQGGAEGRVGRTKESHEDRHLPDGTYLAAHDARRGQEAVVDVDADVSRIEFPARPHQRAQFEAARVTELGSPDIGSVLAKLGELERDIVLVGGRGQASINVFDGWMRNRPHDSLSVEHEDGRPVCIDMGDGASEPRELDEAFAGSWVEDP